jgi:hypothetical protein
MYPDGAIFSGRRILAHRMAPSADHETVHMKFTPAIPDRIGLRARRSARAHSRPHRASTAPGSLILAALLLATFPGVTAAQGATAQDAMAQGGTAQDATTKTVVLLGAFMERNYSTQPGLRVGLAPATGRRWQPRLSASWSTTRLTTALGSHALAEDRLQVGADWFFRQTRRISPAVGVSVGYTRFDRDDDEIFALLDNDAPIVTLLTGAETRLRNGMRVNARIGYSHLQSSTVYPVVASLGMDYPLARGRRP